MEPREATPLSTDTPSSSGPISRNRFRSPLAEVIDGLNDLSLAELGDVQRYAKRVRAARGDRPSPALVSQVVATALRLHLTYSYAVPISMMRACIPNVPRTLLDQALFEAETRQLLRMRPVELPAPFIEISAGIPHARGLLYWIVPTDA